eukprot:m.52093 g.52093  ORF g.52093 m.52093 type:complete len:650 (-) comp11757_c0_seq1:45-1994(-)
MPVNAKSPSTEIQAFDARPIHCVFVFIFRVMETRASAGPLNPTLEERSHALALLSGGRTQSEVRSVLGIKISTLKWWRQQEIHKIPIRKTGRQPFLSAESKQKLQEWLHTRGMMRDALPFADFPTKVVELKAAEMEAAGKNPHAAKAPSNSYLWSLRKELRLETCAKPSVQTPRRQEAIGDLRAFISAGSVFCGILKEEHGPHVPPELLFNVDATSTRITFAGTTVLVPQMTKQLLRATKKSLATTRETPANRYAHVYPVISAAGELLCTISVLHDERFTTGKMNQLDPKTNLWLWTSANNTAEKKNLAKSILLDVILPTTAQRRKEYLARRHELAKMQKLPLPTAEEDEKVRAALCFDGESMFLNCAMDEIAKTVGRHEALRHTEYIKFSASCSLAQQPADVSACFKALKKKMDTLTGCDAGIAVPDYLGVLERVYLAPLEPSTRKIFIDWLRRLPTALSTAFVKTNICNGWAATGFYPFVPKTIMAQSPAFASLTRAQGEACMAAIEKLSSHVLEKGQLTDAEMQEAVGPALVFPAAETHTKSGKKIRTPLEKLSFPRRRAMLLSHSKVVEEHRKRAERHSPAGKRSAEAQSSAPKRARVAKKPKTKASASVSAGAAPVARPSRAAKDAGQAARIAQQEDGSPSLFE